MDSFIVICLQKITLELMKSNEFNNGLYPSM